jgi:predicted SnoaL-like aldol condensation-catalyzing enzyme
VSKPCWFALMLRKSASSVVRQYLEQVWNERRPDVVEKYMSEDFLHHDAPGITDRASVKNFIAGFLGACPDFKISIDHEIAEGDLVVTHYRSSGTQQGEFMGLPASNPTSEQPQIFCALTPPQRCLAVNLALFFP